MMNSEYKNEERVLTREQESMELITMRVNERIDAMEDDYQIGDEYDWDMSDKSQYCKHGKFIGSWWGPDILCGYCEAGE